MIPSNLRQARLTADLTLTQAARGTGLSFERIEAFERGAAIPTEGELVKLAEAFETSRAWLNGDLANERLFVFAP